MSLYLKHPDAAVDYLIDWGERAHGRSVKTSAWAATPDDIAIEPGAPDGALTRATISGGTAGRHYSISARVTFSDGGAAERSMALGVEAR